MDVGSVEGRKGGRRSLDSDVNMVPMIDVLMVTISFLLITAVWTHMSRLEASSKVPGDHAAPPCETGDGCAPRPELHVDMRGADRFVLSWREREAVVRTWDVPRHPMPTGHTGVRFPELAAALTTEWKSGAAPARGSSAERAVLHASDDTRYEEMIAAMDAIYQVRTETKGAPPGFVVTLAMN